MENKVDPKSALYTINAICDGDALYMREIYGHRWVGHVTTNSDLNKLTRSKSGNVIIVLENKIITPRKQIDKKRRWRSNVQRSDATIYISEYYSTIRLVADDWPIGIDIIFDDKYNILFTIVMTNTSHYRNDEVVLVSNKEESVIIDTIINIKKKFKSIPTKNKDGSYMYFK